MIAFLSNAFNDPSDPWYYVVGTLFLLLIFGALAIYIVFSNKKKKKDGENKSGTAKTPDTDTPIDQKTDQKAENNTADVESTQSDEQPTEEEQGEYKVVLTEAGHDKVAVIKAIREYNKLGLVEAKKLVDNLPATVKENVTQAEAEEIANKLKEVGATVEIK